MKSLRYIARLTLAFLQRFKTIIIAGILGGVAIFFLSNLLISAFGHIGSRKIGIVGRYTVDKLPIEILNMIGNGLTQIDEKGDVSPNLASSWETPDKGITWIFHLKEGVLWQDEKEVKSADINYQFSDLQTEKPDAQTLVYKLSDPYSAFPAVVARPIFKKGLLGTGDWLVKKVALSSANFVQQLTLERGKGEKIIYKFYPSEERAKLAFKLGEVGELKGLIDAKPFDSWKKVKIEKQPDKGKFVAIFFKTENDSVSDKVFRQALAYAIDKDSLEQTRAISPISENSWAYNPQVKPYNYDAKKAREQIEGEFEVTLTTSPILLSVAEKIAKNWQDAGVKTNIQAFSTLPDDYQALLVIFDIPEDPDQYSIWHSTQTATNITKYSNPRIDKLLEDGRTEVNLEERRKIYLDFQRFLVEDSPAIFLYYPTIYTIKR